MNLDHYDVNAFASQMYRFLDKEVVCAAHVRSKIQDGYSVSQSFSACVFHPERLSPIHAVGLFFEREYLLDPPGTVYEGADGAVVYAMANPQLVGDVAQHDSFQPRGYAKLNEALEEAVPFALCLGLPRNERPFLIICASRKKDALVSWAEPDIMKVYQVAKTLSVDSLDSKQKFYQSYCQLMNAFNVPGAHGAMEYFHRFTGKDKPIDKWQRLISVPKLEPAIIFP